MLQRSNTVIEVALQMQHRKYCEILHPIFQYIGIISNPKKSEPCGPLLHFMVESPTKKPKSGIQSKNAPRRGSYLLKV